MLKNVVNIDDFSVQFNQYNLKSADEIKGFKSNHLFMNHVAFVGYSVSFSNPFLVGEEEGNNQDP
jgi:hypothetical protein